MKQIRKYKQRKSNKDLYNREHKKEERDIRDLITSEIDNLILGVLRTGIKNPHLTPIKRTGCGNEF